MDSANDYFRNLVSGAKGDINTATVGEIIKFDEKKMKADVQPLIRDADGQTLSMLVEVPVSLMRTNGFIIQAPYKPGDLVVIIFADRDMYNFLLSGSQSTPDSVRKHSLDDAIVIGSILPFTEELTDEYPDDLVIGREDEKSLIILKEDGSIEIKTEKIKIKAVKGIELESPDGVTIKGSSRTESW